MTAFPDIDIRPEPAGDDTIRDFGAPRQQDLPPSFEHAQQPPKPPSARSLQARLEGMYATIAIAVMPFDAAWAETIITNAPACAEAWDALAKENTAVRRMLDRLLTVSATGAVIAAHLPILMTAPGIRDRIAGTFLVMAQQDAATHPTMNGAVG